MMDSLIARRPAALLGLALAIVALAACDTSPPTRVMPKLSYAHLPAFSLRVAEVEIANRYEPPLKSPNVEHLVPVLPGEAAETWARDRLRAAGGPGTARFVISRASVVEERLPVKGGITGAFTREQEARYEAVLEVTLEIRSGTGRRLAFVTSRAERSRTVEEGISLNDRERVWFEMTAAMMEDLDAELARQIRSHLSDYLATS